jgi:heme exporter protein B
VPVRELSRGFQQRVSLARSCLHDPSFLLLDEPFTGLDRETTENLSALLRRLPELGKTVVFSTHDFEQGSAIAERLVAVERGSVRYDGPLSLAPLDALGIAARKAEHSKRKTEEVGAGLTPRQSGPLTPARSPGAEPVAEARVSGYRSSGVQTTPFLLMRNLRVVWAIFVKDLTIEWRHRETLPAMCVFGLLVVFLFNFAFEPAREESLRLLPGLLWIAFAFAGILGFNRSFAAERENGCLDGLSLAPIDPGAIYLGKMIANVVFLGIAEAVVVFAASLWYNFSFVPFLRWFSFIVLLGTLGFTALGTIFGAIAANTRMREVMLPVLQFPVAFWVLILAIDATSGALRGESASGIAAGVKLLAGVSAVFWVASFLLFEYVLEE